MLYLEINYLFMKKRSITYNGIANRCSGKVRTELSDCYKSYRHKIIIKFNLKPE